MRYTALHRTPAVASFGLQFSFTYKCPRATFELEVFIMEWFGLISSVVAVVGAAASVFRRLKRLTIEDLHGAAFSVVLDDAHTKFQPYLYLELTLRNRLRNDVHIVATGLSMGHTQCVPDYDAIETIEKHSGGQNEDADKSVQISYYGTSIPTTLLRT